MCVIHPLFPTGWLRHPDWHEMIYRQIAIKVHFQVPSLFFAPNAIYTPPLLKAVVCANYSIIQTWSNCSGYALGSTLTSRRTQFPINISLLSSLTGKLIQSPADISCLFIACWVCFTVNIWGQNALQGSKSVMKFHSESISTLGAEFDFFIATVK